MDIINSGARAFELPAGAILTMRQDSPGAIATAAQVYADGATGFTSTALTSATPASVGPLSHNARIIVAAVGSVSVDVIGAAVVAIVGGTIDGTPIGTTTPAVVKASDYQASYTDISGTPGAGTVNTPRGRAAFAASASSVVITNSLVTATSMVDVQLGGTDATAKSVTVTPGAGSFTVTANAAATGITPFNFIVLN